MVVSLIGNRSDSLNTWTQQSVNEIARLTSVGGSKNRIKAMGQAGILAGSAIGDAIYFSLEAAKALASLNMALMIVRINLAVRHGIQGGLAFPVIIVPRLALTTTEWLSIKDQDLASNWIDRARDLARRIGANYIDHLQSNPRAILALKLGGILTTAGLVGSIVYLNTSTKKGMEPVQKPLEHTVKIILGVASFVVFLGFGFGLRKNRISQTPRTQPVVQVTSSTQHEQVNDGPQEAVVTVPTPPVRDEKLERNRISQTLRTQPVVQVTSSTQQEQVDADPQEAGVAFPTPLIQDEKLERNRRVERSLGMVQRYLATCRANLEDLNSQVKKTTGNEQEVEVCQETPNQDEGYKWEKHMVTIERSPELLQSYTERCKLEFEKLNDAILSYTLGREMLNLELIDEEGGCAPTPNEVDALQHDKTIQDLLALCDEAEIIADRTIQLSQEISKR
ncbi:MAG: hypothetical protein Q8K75_01725 [Chlamydiales bacterium]|nr:hypothetical protein [Chlamydiales bacterium]